MPSHNKVPLTLGCIEFLLSSGQTVSLDITDPETNQHFAEAPEWLRRMSLRLFPRGSYHISNHAGQLVTIPLRHIVAIRYTPTTHAD